MKKRILILTGLMMLLLSTAIQAEVRITESPHVKIVINGMIGDYEDVTLIVNDRAMLPLRAVVTNLGVLNDDEHIIWDGVERSVTVVTEDTTVWLQIDNYTAKVNGVDVALDVAPMIYPKNNRSYIPARFISETLGKIVAWDGSTRAVLIAETEGYEAIEDVLKKSSEAMEGVENLAMDLSSTISTTGTEDFSMTINMNVIENPQQPASYLKLGLDIDMDALMAEDLDAELSEEMTGQMFLMAFLNMEIYEMEDTTYSKTFFSGDGWLTSETATDEDEDEASNGSLAISQDTMMLGTEDTVIAGLVMEDRVEEGTIVLKGSVYIEDMANQSLSLNGASLNDSFVNDYYIIYTLDRTTYEIISLQMDLEIVGPDETGIMTTVKSSTLVTMDVLEDDYKIVVPEDVLNNIVEMNFGFQKENNSHKIQNCTKKG